MSSIGAFSMSLTVKDIHASKDFYEKLGFQDFGGDISQNWLIMKNDDVVIGLFQGIIEQNILTFTPGWDENAQELDSFKDVRVLQEEFREKGLTFTTEVEANTEGPGHFILEDPDGNIIMVDQYR